jgi:hypothetical protein
VTAAKDLPSFGEGYWEQKETAALRLLTDWMNGASTIALSSGLLHSFTNRLQDGDVVITFNWDALVEQSLHKQNRRINLLARDDSAVTVLKLHGCINWCFLPDGPKHQDPDWVVHLGERVYRTVDYAYYDLWGIEQRPPFIIPPTTMKRPPAEPLLSSLWGEAFNVLIEAKQLCFIGYSIPNDDLQARTLFRSGLALNQRKYLVVDPDPAVAEKYFGQIGSNVTFLQCYFDEDVLDRFIAD